jgi:hypothetical protein
MDLCDFVTNSYEFIWINVCLRGFAWTKLVLFEYLCIYMKLYDLSEFMWIYMSQNNFI